MTWGNLWFYLLITIIVILGFALFAKGIAWAIVKNRNNLYWIIPITAGLLTYISISQLQDSSVLFKTEAPVLQKLNDTKLKLIYPLYKDKEDEQFVHDNFILINTSFDPYLIPNRERLTGDSTFITITDRKKLSNFLNFVQKNVRLFDLIVCDIVFQDTSAYDKNLKINIDKIEEANKIILAYNKNFVNKSSTIYEGLKPSSYGEVAKVEKDQPFYFTHRLVNEENIPSLPYQMHLRLSGNVYKEHDYYLWPKMLTEKDRNDHNGYAFNEYITELRFTNEKDLYNDSIDNAGNRNDITSIQDTSLISSSVEYIYNLGYACTEEAQQQILDLISLKNKKCRNIVMIGNFKDAYSDKHQTAYGPLYGTTILLNEFFQIDNSGHSMAGWQVFVYVSTLFLCFCGVLAILFIRASKDEKNIKHIKKGLLISLVSKDGFLVNLSEFLLDEIHFILLFFVAIIIDVFFHKIINVLGLLYYFLLFSALLKFFIGKAKNENVLNV